MNDIPCRIGREAQEDKNTTHVDIQEQDEQLVNG